MAKHTVFGRKKHRARLAKATLDQLVKSRWFMNRAEKGSGLNLFSQATYRSTGALFAAMKVSGYRGLRDTYPFSTDELCKSIGINREDFNEVAALDGSILAFDKFLNPTWAVHFLEYVKSMDTSFTYDTIYLEDADGKPLFGDAVEVVLNEMPTPAVENEAREHRKDTEWGSW